MIYISLFFINSILSFITCTNYLPRFESLPPPLVYYTESIDESSKVLTCKAWPPTTEIKLYSTMRLGNSDSSNPSQSQYMKTAPLHPLDSEYVKGSSVVVKSVTQARALSKLDLHCLAETKFGAVISRPFRVVEARIGQFPSAKSTGEAQKIIKQFMHSNVAYVDCEPPISFPPAVIEFKVNDSALANSPRYKYIRRPNSRRVTLLILAFEPRDEGYYRCMATNTVTGETKTDPLVQMLKIKRPVTNQPTSIKMTIAGKEVSLNSGYSHSSVDTIQVREGMNVTLFCVMEGAPPPSVTTFKIRGGLSSQNRHISDKEFGLLSITKVGVEDEDSYQCSDSSSSDTAQLKVQKRLSITHGPQDIRVSKLNDEARFTCISSDTNIIPQWYFNGRIRTQNVQAAPDSSLLITNVRREDLGVYQCVARSEDEWVTEVASLSLKGEDPVSKDDDGKVNGGDNGGPGPLQVGSGGDVRRLRIKKNEELPSPSVTIIEDNLAVLLRWKAEDGANGVARHYRVQYKSSKVSDGPGQESAMQTLENEITERHFYVTSGHLKPQYVYYFRISVVMITGVSQYSAWSQKVSFAHIYPVQPTIQLLKQYNHTHLYFQWQYAYVGIHPVTEYKIMVRKVVQEGSKNHYSKFWYFLVPNREPMDTLIGPLGPGYTYQVIVYGIKHTPPRMVTMFSPEVTIATLSAGTSSTSNWSSRNHNTESNTRLMFVILGSLAGLMVLVIVVLVLMCYCRERKSSSSHRGNNRYKDPAKQIHNNEQTKAVQSSFLLASISAAANANKCQDGVLDNNGGEHASLLSTIADNVYYQQKRQPPSGGSGHDMSDGEGVSVCQDSQSIAMHHGHNPGDPGTGLMHMTMQQAPPSSLSTVTTGMLTPQPPAITYYKALPGPASLPAGSLLRHNPQAPPPQQQFSPQQRYSPGFQYGPQLLYTNTGMVYSPQGSYLGTMYSPPGAAASGQPQMIQAGPPRQDMCDMRSQDGGESVYSYFSQTSNNNNNPQRQCGLQGTVETGSQTMNSNGSAGHRHHRRKRRKTNNSGGTGVMDGSDMCGTQPKMSQMRGGMYPGTGVMHGGSGGGQQREVMYDTPPSNHHQQQQLHHHQDPRMISVPPGMVLMQPGMGNGGGAGMDTQCWGPAAQMNNTLTRRGTPTLFVEPPRIRDYSEYGIPHNQMMVVGGGGGGGQPQQQLAHLSQQNLHLHNQNLSGGYRDAQA